MATLIFPLYACAVPDVLPDTGICTVVIEDGQDYAAQKRVQKVKRNNDLTFQISLFNGCMIASSDYENYSLEQSESIAFLTLHNVRYSTVVRLQTAYEYVIYDGNGGNSIEGEETRVKVPCFTGHLNMNTALGTELFTREGYVLTGWNTQSDGFGVHIGLGSRTERKKGLTLYAEWAKSSPIEDFSYEIIDGTVAITEYRGEDETCVIPEKIEGYKVRKIKQYAFQGNAFETLVLPSTLIEIEKNAFCNAFIKEIYCYDTLVSVQNDSFSSCNGLTTLHINAGQAPVYSGTYYDTFTDKFDRLSAIKEEKKIVLFSGSSARFGYDSPRLKEAFPTYDVMNMGVYAYTNALPQLEMIKTCMKEGDILLEAPEFDAIPQQFCTTNEMDKHLFCMVESNYDLFALLDLKNYKNVFSSFGLYLSEKSLLEEKSYHLSAKNFDEDGNEMGYETYNEYGDFIFKRPNGEKEEMLKYIRTDYTINAFPKSVIQSLNNALLPFIQMGIKVYVSYAPRNISSLTEESTLKARWELHQYLSEQLVAPLISDIEDYLYSAIYFYEIDNHLSDEGVQIRTDKIIKDLKEVLKNE